MNCPWCPFAGPPRSLHAHLAEAHPEEVVFGEKKGRAFYSVSCPVCGSGYEHAIKPRSRDADFIEEYEREIRLVGFDMLVNHLIAEHAETQIDT